MIVNGILESNLHPGWDADTVDSFFLRERGEALQCPFARKNHPTVQPVLLLP